MVTKNEVQKALTQLATTGRAGAVIERRQGRYWVMLPGMREPLAIRQDFKEAVRVALGKLEVDEPQI